MKKITLLTGTILVLILAFYLTGCPQPVHDPDPETGNVFLTIGRLDMSWTIQPTNVLADFADITVRFTRGTEIINANVTGVTTAIVSALAMLPASGIDWTLTVRAYLPDEGGANLLAAQYVRTGITVEVGDNHLGNIELRPIRIGTGTFSWGITFPDDFVTGGIIQVRNAPGGTVIETVPLPTPITSPWASTLNLPVGDYYAVITMNAGAESANFGEDLHVYQNMVSHRDFEFTYDLFLIWPDVPPAPTANIIGYTIPPITVSSGGTHTTIGNSIYITSRVNNYNGIDIISVRAGDEVVVVGRVSQRVADGARMEMGLNIAPYTHFTYVGVGVSCTFELRYIVPSGVTTVRIQTNTAAATMPFVIDHILITQPGLAGSGTFSITFAEFTNPIKPIPSINMTVGAGQSIRLDAGLANPRWYRGAIRIHTGHTLYLDDVINLTGIHLITARADSNNRTHSRVITVTAALPLVTYITVTGINTRYIPGA